MNKHPVMRRMKKDFVSQCHDCLSHSGAICLTMECSYRERDSVCWSNTKLKHHGHPLVKISLVVVME